MSDLATEGFYTIVTDAEADAWVAEAQSMNHEIERQSR